MADGDAAPSPQKVQLPIARVIEDVDADLAGEWNLPACCLHLRYCASQQAASILNSNVDDQQCIRHAGRQAEERIQELNEHYQTYGMVEQQLMQRRARLMGKLPEIQKTLDALLMLQQRQQDEQEVGRASLFR